MNSLLFLEEFDLNVSQRGVDGSHVGHSAATARLEKEKEGRQTRKEDGRGKGKIKGGKEDTESSWLHKYSRTC